MRLLSNLIKANYIYYNQKETKMIDSDSHNGLFTPLTFAKVDTKQETYSDFSEDEIAASEEPMLLDIETHFEKERREIEEAGQRIEEAKQEADQLLQNAAKEAEQLYENAREQGKAEGYQAGIYEAHKETEKMQQKLQNQIAANQEEYEKQLTQIEPKFVELILKYLEKLTGVIVEDKKDVILYLLDHALKKIECNASFIIRVSQEDYGFVEAHKDRLLQGMREDAKLEILEDKTMSKNQCMIETNDRMMDCSLDVQLGKLIEDLRILSIQ